MTRDDMKVWVFAALRSLAGNTWAGDVGKYIWHAYDAEHRSLDRCFIRGNTTPDGRPRHFEKRAS